MNAVISETTGLDSWD